jgi:2-oxoglutarate dehydrogenase E2 component (dihydrolipoamide succinyltransferase)
MAKIEILMPHMGESILECSVLKWLVSEGDFVKVDDMILEVATDKIDTEIGCSHEGVLVQKLVQEGEVAIIGKPICILDTTQEQIILPSLENKEQIHEIQADLEKKIGQILPQNSVTKAETSERFFSPLVLSIAKEESISKFELDQIPGTGQNGRLTKDDLLAYLKVRTQPQHSSPKTQSIEEKSKWPATDTIIAMDRMRKMIAERMVESKRISPHVTSFIETDMSSVVKWRETEKNHFRTKYNTGGLTFTPILVEAVVHAIKKYPGLNIQVDGDKIIQKKDVNIGVAVALPSGNLIVPVVQHADQMDLAELALKINDLATRAKNNKLKSEELVGGTYTISNIGGFGNIAGTPIIMQPQVGIMAFGVIRKMPAVLELPEGDVIAIRQKMIVSHSYDHRVIDGSLGGLFLKEVSDYLEKFDTKRTFR